MLCIYLSLLASFPADSHRSILNWKFCLLIRLQQHTANIVMSLVLNFEHTAVHRYNAYFSLMLQHFRRTTGAIVLRVTCILRWIFYLCRIFFLLFIYLISLEVYTFIYLFDIFRSTSALLRFTITIANTWCDCYEAYLLVGNIKFQFSLIKLYTCTEDINIYNDSCVRGECQILFTALCEMQKCEMQKCIKWQYSYRLLLKVHYK